MQHSLNGIGSLSAHPLSLFRRETPIQKLAIIPLALDFEIQDPTSFIPNKHTNTKTYFGITIKLRKTLLSGKEPEWTSKDSRVLIKAWLYLTLRRGFYK